MSQAKSKSSVSTKVLKAMSIFSGVQSIGILCSIIRTKFIALWIGEVGVGLFAIFNSVLEMVSTGSQLNLRQSAVRDISAAPKSRVGAIASAVRWWSIRLGIAGGILMLVLAPLLSIASFDNTSMWWAFAFLAIGVLASAYTNGEQALMQGTGRLRALAKSSVTGALVGTAFSVPLYYLLGESSIIPTILIFSVMGAISVSYFNDTKSDRCMRKDNITAGKGFLRLGVYLTVSSVVTTAASYAFISYMNQTASTADVGLYQAGYTLVIRYTGIIFTALSMEFFPRITQISDRARMASTVVSHEISLVMYVLTPLITIFVCCDSLLVTLLYKHSFLTMLPFVTIGIGAMVFRALSYCMAYVIISRGDGRTYILTEIASSIIGLGLNISMFHYWSFVGLGISYVTWYIIYSLIVWAVCHFKYGMRLSTMTIKLLAGSALIVAAAILLKQAGWWAVTPLIIISGAISLYGLKKLIRNH